MKTQSSDVTGFSSDWNRLDTPLSEVRLLRFGSSRIWIERRPTGWGIALDPPVFCESGEAEACYDEALFSYIPQSKPAELNWSSYYVQESEDALIAEFALPDKPLAAHPEEPILLPDGESGRFSTAIPLDLRLKTIGEGRLLITVPSMILSKSLFGAPDSGEIVYSSPLQISHRSELAGIPPYCARCDLQVLNVSGGVLDFNRVCLRVEYLGLYFCGDRFLTDDINFAFRGADQASSLSFSRQAAFDDCVRINPPRITGYGNLIRKSFDFFKSLASY